jgi:DNA polymerase I
MLVTARNFRDTIELIRRSPRLIIDTETNGVDVWHDSRMIGISTTTPELARRGKGFYFPFRHRRGRRHNLTPEHLAELIEVFNRPRVIHTGWNYKFDLLILAKEGMRLPDRAEDMMLGAHLMNENEYKIGSNYKLKHWARRYLKVKAAAARELDDLLVGRGLGKGQMDMLSPREVDAYATDDVLLTERARRFLCDPLRRWELWQIFREVSEYMIATTRMEMRGMLLDVPLTKKYTREAERKEKKAYKTLARHAGYDINPQSNPQLQAFLGLRSTAKEVLEEIVGDERVDALQVYRGWNKVRVNYYNKYLVVRDAHDAVHPNINLHGTISGRPSASDPPMQAVPRYTEVYKVKDVFVARRGFVLVSADYSQAELRFVTHYTRDREMRRILMAGGDIHQATADLLGIDRDTAKRINFGVVYGIGAPGLSKRLHIARQVAAKFLNTYHAKFNRLRPLYRYMEGMAKDNGYIRLWTGRVRRYNHKGAEPHKALSNLIQGGVAEIMRLAILRLNRAVVAGSLQGSHMLLQVHDQILFEVPINKLHQHVRRIKAIMEDFDELYVPMVVEIKTGDRWGDLTLYEDPKQRKAA